MKARLFYSAGAVAVLALMQVSAAAAQDAAPQTAAPQTLDEVVVTAQKRSQNVQDVPISMQVATGAAIASAGFRNIQDLATGTPSLKAQKGPSGDSIAIRGVQAPNGPSFEQAVGVFIDGVYFGRSRAMRSAFLDLDRAEILKGPQSIYFGNNAIAGAYSIVTANPGKALNGYVTASVEPVANERVLEGAVGGPINGTMGLRLALSHAQSDGWIKNSISGRGPASKDSSGRLTFAWAPVDAFDLNVKVGGYDIKGRNNQGFELMNCPVQAPFVVNGPVCRASLQQFPGTDVGLNWVASNNPLFNTQRGDNQVITANYRFGDGYTLTSVTGRYHFKYQETFDQDYTPVLFAGTNNTEETTQTSQEVRLTSPADKRFSYILGAYYHKQDHDVLARNGSFPAQLTPAGIAGLAANGIAAGNFPVQLIGSDYGEESASAFAAATYRFTDSLRATFGVRRIEVRKDVHRTNFMGYSNDIKMMSYAQVPIGSAQDAALRSAAGNLPPSATFDRRYKLNQSDTLPSLNVQWDVAPQKMIYFTASKGFQAGGFDEQGRTLSAVMQFDPETVQAQELGLKAEWFGRRLMTNIDYFHAEYSNLQRSVPVVNGVNVSSFISSVGTLKSQGVELQVRWRATDRLELNLNATRLNTEYGDDVVGACSTTQTFLTPAGQACVQRLGGKAPISSPDYSGEVSAKYVQPIGDGLQLTAQGNVFFSGDYEVDGSFDPLGHQDAFQRVGFRLAVSPQNGPWEVALVGRNVTNEKVKLSCGAVAGGTGSYGCTLDRRNSYMLQANYRF